MPISFNESSRVFHLQGKSFSYCLYLDDALGLMNLYWGSRLPDGDLGYLMTGYWGGASDHILTGLCDILLAFPDSVFAIAVAGILGAGIFHTVFALGLIWWTKYARLSRTLTLSVGNRDYIWQAKFAGARTGRILFKYILPEILPQLLTAAALDVGNMMLALAGLSFLGLASQPPAPEWGYMLYESRQYMQTAPWMMIFPGLALLLSVGVFNLLGDAVRDALSPGPRKIDT